MSFLGGYEACQHEFNDERIARLSNFRIRLSNFRIIALFNFIALYNKRLETPESQ